MAMTESGSDFHYDDNKPRMDLVPWSAVVEVAKVCAFGASKYGDRNNEKHRHEWRWGQLLASAHRHLAAWSMREDNDPQSGLSHLAHAAWNILTLLAFVSLGFGRDDRTLLVKEDA